VNSIIKKEYNLEALRGYSALFVVIGHIILYNKYLDPNYFPKLLYSFQVPGHVCVLVFFVLSGYVIGISNKQKLNKTGIKIYLKKRFVRIYPIYITSILLALLVATSNYSLSTIFYHLTFTQILFSPVIAENSPIWSLHYEILYYLLFIPIAYYSLSPLIIATLSITIGLINFYFYSILNIPIVTSYLFGFTFWLCGLIIAKLFNTKELNTNFTLLLSNLFLMLSLGFYNSLTSITAKIAQLVFNHYFEFAPNIYWFKRAITFLDLTYLPYCIMFIIVFSGYTFKYKKPILIFLQLLPLIKISLLGFLYFSNNHSLVYTTEFTGSAIYYVISLFLFFINSEKLEVIATYIIKFGIWIGSISYGIYIIHFPILIIFKQINFFSGSILSFIVRVVLFISLTFFISYLLEKKFQPWVKRAID